MRVNASGMMIWSTMWLILSAVGTGASGDQRLVEAVKRQDRAAIQSLLEQHVDVNAPAGDGATALHWAVHRDDLDTVDALIRAGANVNAADSLGGTALSLACLNRSAILVDKLLSVGGNPNATPITGESPLMTASRTGSVEAVKTLLFHGANVNAKEVSRGQTALMWAVAQQHLEVARLLIEAGADVEARTLSYAQRVSLDGERPNDVAPADYQKGGSTPLLFAARVGDLESAKLLLAAGANVNDTAPDGMSAVVLATRSGHEKFAQFLIEQGADPNAADAGYSALHAAVLMGDLGLVKTLLAHRANPNAPLTKGTPIRRGGEDLELPLRLMGATPFLLAAKYADVNILRVLAAGGADPRIPMKNGTTALMAAAGFGWAAGSPDSLRGANRRGVDYDRSTNYGSMLRAQEEKDTLESVTLLLDLGVDPNGADLNGNTALFGAVPKGFDAVIQLLVERGANVNVKNKRGQTPLKLTAPRARNAAAGDAAELNAGELKSTADLLRKLGAQE
jgi:ankyrin repeat protein